MHSARMISFAVALGAGMVVVGAADARAQETGEAPPRPTLEAPAKTFEVKLATGYTQGFGNLSPGRSIGNAAGAGLAISLDADYRIDKYTSVGLETQYQQFALENNNGSYGLTGTLGATYHATPERRGDFWGRIGTGYRMLWEVDPVTGFGTTNLYHGLTVASVKLGYDFRTSSDIAIAPMVGADLQTFIWKDAERFGTPQWGTFIYAGIQGRFDAMPRSTGAVVTARR